MLGKMQEAIEETAGREMTVENTDRLDVLCRDKRQTAEAFAELRKSGDFIPALEMGKLQEAVENPAALTEYGKVPYNDEKAMPMPIYFNHAEPILINSKKVKPIDGYEDVFIHGDENGFATNDSDGNLCNMYTPREFAEILKNDPNYHGGDIRLCSCKTGAEGAIAAKALARQLGVNILAPSDTLWIHMDGTMTIGADQFMNDGQWILFESR